MNRIRKRTNRTQSRVFLLLFALWVMAFVGCRKDADNEATPSEASVVVTKTGIEMISIPAGWFEMGDKDGPSDEKPAHRVYVSIFLMDRYEVTQAQYARFPLPDPSHFMNPQNPVEQINWSDALEYCNERSLEEGFKPCYDLDTGRCDFDANGYRLPTEAEWEYACRAGTKTVYSFGSIAATLGSSAWFKDNSSGKTHPVGTKKPNAWGLFDMHGNVKEWCNDYYDEDYYKNSPEKDPRGPAEGKERVVRGGAWDSSSDSCRSSYRAGDASINDTCLASDAIGFRCVRKAPTDSNSITPTPSPEGERGTRINAKEQEATMSSESLEPAPSTGFLYDEVYLDHLTGAGHPEQPARLTAVVHRLKATGLDKQLAKLGPVEPAPIEWIARVHTHQYIERARQSCQQGARLLDSLDVPISRDSYEVAIRAVGGVLAAVDAVMEGKVSNAFCAVRPPGHHATADRAMGFCMFNNVAIAARYIQDKYDLPKVLIVDWDVHHGNGTQATFYDDPNVLYFGVHQYPFYPGTGAASERGIDAGLNHTINVPLPHGSGDAEFLRAFKEKLIPAATAFRPDFVLISAGFDAYEHDLLGGMKVTVDGFGKLTEIVKAIAERSCNGRIVSALEGGYQLEGLAACVEAHLRALI